MSSPNRRARWTSSLAVAGLALGTLVGPAATVASAADTGCPTPSTAFPSGDGSATPYEIATPGDLQLLKEDNSFWGSAFVLSADIAMSGCTWDRGIGTNSTPFSGTVDGNGHAIQNITVAVSGDYSSDVDGGVAGLFGKLGSAADIHDLEVSGSVSADITGSAAFAFAGGLAGKTSQAAVTNVRFTGDVRATATGNHAYAGGIVGSSSASAYSLVSSSASVSAVSFGRPTSGGIVGDMRDNTTVSDSWALGSVYSDGTDQSTSGGIAGTAWGGTIQRSFAGASVTAMPALQPSAGGIAGVAMAHITDTYSRSSIWGANFTGGLVGWLIQDDPQYQVERSYYSGSLRVGSPTQALGGIGGVDRTQGGAALITADTYWDAQVTGVAVPVGLSESDGTVNPPVTGATGESTATMKTASTYATWDLAQGYDPAATWNICSGYNDGYPFLSSLLSASPCGGVAPRSITPASQTISGDIGATIATTALTTTGFTDTPVFTISPALPNGLTFNSLTGEITGTIQGAGPATTYTITAQSGMPFQQATATVVKSATTKLNHQISTFTQDVYEDGAFTAVATNPVNGKSLVVATGSVLSNSGGYDVKLLAYTMDDSFHVVGDAVQFLDDTIAIGNYSQPSVAYNPATGGWLTCFASVVGGGSQPYCQYLHPNGTADGSAFTVGDPFTDRWNQNAIAYSEDRGEFLVVSTAWSNSAVGHWVDPSGGGTIGSPIPYRTAGSASTLPVNQSGGVDLAYSTSSGTFGLVVRGRANNSQNQGAWFYHLDGNGVPRLEPQRLVPDTSVQTTNASIAYNAHDDVFMTVTWQSQGSWPLITQPYAAGDGARIGSPVETPIDNSVIYSWGWRPSIASHSSASEYLVTAPMSPQGDQTLRYYTYRLDGAGVATGPDLLDGTANERVGNRPRVAFNDRTCEFVTTYQRDSATWGWQLFGTWLSTPNPCDSSALPTEPLNASATAGDESAEVTWDEPSSPGSSAITSYEVTATPGGATCTATAPTRTCTVNGLTNGTSYTFTVRAENESGQGPASQPSNAVTPAAAPSPPVFVSAIAGDTTAVVSWTEPTSSDSLPVMRYQVTGSPGGATCSVAAPSLSCTVDGLTNGTTYTFRVRARNEAGWSDLSAASNAVTPRAAPTPSILISGYRDKARIHVEGTAVAMAGERVSPHYRFPGQPHYTAGVATRSVADDGTFTWSRKTWKKAYVYFSGDGVRSNRVIIAR